MRYKFYTTSEKAWDAMLEAMSGAHKSIFLEMYIFVDNIDTHHFFEILKEKAKNGIKVKLILDSYGSSGIDSATIAEVRNSGVELMFFSYWLRRTHKKILVVDGKIAFLGGVNIHKLFRKWNDLQIYLTGPIVKSVARSFAKTYLMCGGKDQDVLAYDGKKTILRRTKLWFLEYQHISKKSLFKKHYQDRLLNAKEKIIIVTPYFVPHRWLIGLLHQAILRGVEVEIILPQKTDLWHMDRVNHFYVSRLYSLGIKFYLKKEMIHAKAMIVDGVEGMVGSQNIDPLSFEHNLEAGIFFRDEKMVKDLLRIINDWQKESIIFEPSIYKKTWPDYLIAPVIRVFQAFF